MRFVKINIELLIVVKNFVLLGKFNMAAHDDDRLPHEEHEKPADQRQDEQDDS